jgi:plastocyanin
MISSATRIGIGALALMVGCSDNGSRVRRTESKAQPTPSYFKVDPGTVGTVKGLVRFVGRRPARKYVDMSSEPACVEAHDGKAYDESLDVNPNGTLANVFVYVKTGLEGKRFEIPAAPVTIDQQGCWFRPRVLGIQIGQVLQVTNSDPVTHNIHPLAQINREWNHSQGEGDPSLARKFTTKEIMVRVKCNIHSWMHAFIGILDHPYFAVTGADGRFEIRTLPPGEYTLEAWQETMGTQEQKITLSPSATMQTNFVLKGD